MIVTTSSMLFYCMHWRFKGSKESQIKGDVLIYYPNGTGHDYMLHHGGTGSHDTVLLSDNNFGVNRRTLE